jgi:hypothetical protein
MTSPVPSACTVALGLWIPLTLWAFARRPAPIAALVGVVGGWLVLPTAELPEEFSRYEFPFWVMPACLPSASWTTKARVVGLACLLGVLLFDRRALGRLRPAWPDLFVVGWCACPLATSLANRLYPTEAIADAAYLALAWGVPYLLGRLYFAGPAGNDLLARGLIVAGLATAPLCLLEWGAGPWLYATAYGFHAFQYQGASRYLGFRPLLFLEDGNQLGMWVATAALVAAWLRRSGRLESVGSIPGGFVTGALVGVALLAQSVGAIVLLLAGLAGLEGVRRLGRTWPLAVGLALVLGFVGMRAANLVDAKALAERTGVGRALIGASIKVDRQSFGWRLRVEERHARTALQRPVLGWGRWDWWRGGALRPWGLFSLVLGMYGLAGLALLLGTLLAPLIRFLGLGPPRSWADPDRAAAAGLAAALAINGLDATLNGAFLLPVLLAAGGLAGRDARAVVTPGSGHERPSAGPGSAGNVRYRIR